MILNNKVSQRLEIIGFKGAVKKSTSRIQVIVIVYHSGARIRSFVFIYSLKFFTRKP